MATSVLQTGQTFPSGTTVGAYLTSAQLPGSNQPNGTPVETAVVSGGTVVFSALAADTEYDAWGQVSGQWARIRFHTAAIPPEGLAADSEVGGVLSGPILEPGFAQDMATQPELDAVLAALAAHAADETGVHGVADMAQLVAKNAAAAITGPWTFPSPTADGHPATKAYTDAIAAGLSTRASCRLATAAALPANTRTGNVLTASANGALSVDGVAVAVNDRILVKDEATGANNGIFVVTATGGAGAAFVLTRSADADQDAEVISGIFVFITAGTANTASGWVLITANPITVNTTVLNWTQRSAAGAVQAGTGIDIAGQVVSVETVLAALNALAAAANKLPYFTSGSAAALTDLTLQGRQLLDDTSFPLMRQTLGLVIGTDVAAAAHAHAITDVVTSTTLNGAITNTAASLVVASAAGFPTVAPFRIQIESETILVGAVSGTTFSSLTRGFDGTTAASHANAVAVTQSLASAIPAINAALTIVQKIQLSTGDRLATAWALGDAGKVFDSASTSDRVLTVPSEAQVPFPDGTFFEACRTNTGAMTIQGQVAAMFETPLAATARDSVTIPMRWGTAGFRKRTTDKWIVSGAIA